MKKEATNPVGFFMYLQVFALERHLIQLTAFVADSSQPTGVRNITLHDICFRPLAPQNNNCMVLSVSQYFQSDPDNLHVKDWFNTTNWLDHAMYCAQNPLQNHAELGLSCLGVAGAPVHPDVIFAGFEGRDYGNATGLLVMFLVNNPLNRTKTDEALAWEKAAIEYLKGYPAENLIISFMLEVRVFLLHDISDSLSFTLNEKLKGKIQFLTSCQRLP